MDPDERHRPGAARPHRAGHPRQFFLATRPARACGQGPSLALFGGSEIKDRSRHFTYADVSTIFGGATLDLWEARIDEQATVDATALFGGVDILVPEGWRVTMRGVPVFGGYQDKTHNYMTSLPDQAPILHVNTTSIFGGVTVANEPD